MPIPFQRNRNNAPDPIAYGTAQLRLLCQLVQPATFRLESKQHLDLLLFALLVEVPALEARAVLEDAARIETREFQQRLIAALLARLETLRTAHLDSKLADLSLERSLRFLCGGASDMEAVLCALSQDASPQALVVLGIALQGASVAATDSFADRMRVAEWQAQLVEAVRQTGLVNCDDYDGGLNSGMRIAQRAREAAETLGGLR